MNTYFRVNITARVRKAPYHHSWADALLKEFGAGVIHREVINWEGDWALVYIEANLRNIDMDQFVDFRRRWVQGYRNGLSYGNERPFNGREEMFAEMVAEIETWSVLPSQPMDPQFVFRGGLPDEG